jgi:hypothetical protein
LTATGAGGLDTLMRANYITVVAPVRAWQPLSTATSPPVKGEYAMVYDSDRDVVVLYGGNASGWPYEYTTWEFDGADWSVIPTTRQPQAVYGMAIAYDGRRGRVVLFGGRNSADVSLAQTWEYDGRDWTQRLPVTSPTARANPALVHDANSGQVLLFGGHDGGTYYDDTWVYDGSNWSQVIGGTSPPARTLHAMASNPDDGTILLFGGRSASSILYADLWSFNPATSAWIQISSSGPPARQAHSFAYDGGAGEFVLTSGTGDASDTLLNDTWHYRTATGWVEATAAPEGAYHTAVYDGNAILLLVDGETWQYR